MADKTELIAAFEERAQTYGFLSQVFFRELPLEAIEELSRIDYSGEPGNENLRQGYKLVRRFFAFCDKDARTQLAVEYARVFLAAGVYSEDRQVAAPYESVFTSPEKLMMQEARDDVYRIYLRDGFTVKSDLHEPEDHLAFELEYLANLSSRIVAAVGQDDEAEMLALITKQKDFIARHLLNWISRLRETAQSYAQLTFYIGMLLIAEGILEEDRDFLSSLEDELQSVSNAA